MKGIIFDFNGTLYWDSQLHYDAWREFSKIIRGYEFTDTEMRDKMFGHTNEDIIEYAIGKKPSKEMVEKYGKEKESLYRKRCLLNPETFKLAPGAVEFLDLYLTVNNDLQEKVVNSNLFSVMRVYSEFCVTKNVSGFFGNTTETKTEIASGSAVIYKVEADYTYVITNYHVVYNSNANSDNGSTKIAKNIAGYLYGTYEGPKSNGADGDYTIYEYGKSALMMEYIGGSITKDIAVLRIPTETIRAQNANVRKL